MSKGALTMQGAGGGCGHRLRPLLTASPALPTTGLQEADRAEAGGHQLPSDRTTGGAGRPDSTVPAGDEVPPPDAAGQAGGPG